MRNSRFNAMQKQQQKLENMRKQQQSLNNIYCAIVYKIDREIDGMTNNNYEPAFISEVKAFKKLVVNGISRRLPNFDELYEIYKDFVLETTDEEMDDKGGVDNE